MDTFVTLTLPKHYNKLFYGAFDIVKQVDDSLSSYKDHAKIAMLNQNKYIKNNYYSYDALTLAQRYYKLTEGYFNVAIGRISKDGFGFGLEQKIPDTNELQQYDINLSKLYVDEHIAKIDGDIKIDLGGMGKGYGVDKVVEFLKRHGVQKGSVALSGDIRCLDRCGIKVQSPFNDEAVATLHTKQRDTAISTSGIYNRYVDDVTHNHLIDPHKKKSQHNFISITLIAKLANSDLDAFATAVSVMPKKKAYAFLKKMGIGYIIMEDDEKVRLSGNLFSFIDVLVIDHKLLYEK